MLDRGSIFKIDVNFPIDISYLQLDGDQNNRLKFGSHIGGSI